MKSKHQLPWAIKRTVTLSVLLGVLCAAGFGQTRRRTPQPPPPLPGAPDTSVTRHGISAEVSGTLSVNEGKIKREIKLRYVYAAYYGGIETVGNDPSWDLFFSDRQLPEDRAERGLYVSVLTRERKMNGLEIQLRAGGVIQMSRIYCAICARSDGEEYRFNSEDEQVFESKAIDGKTVAGTLRSSQLHDESGTNEGAMFQYRVTFKIVLDDKPQLSKLLSEADDEPGRAYLSFYKAVQAEDLNAARKLLADEHRKVFEGPTAKETFLRLKSYLKPFSKVAQSQVFGGDRSAHLLVEEEIPGIPSRYPRAATTRVTQSIPPPPPPPPPAPPGMVVLQKGMRPAGRGPTRSDVTPPPRMPVMAVAKMVLEDKQWKIDWLLEGRFNVLSENYRTPEERAMVEEEARRKEEEEYFAVEGGAALPAGGGEAGKAYLDFCRAERIGDKKIMIKYLTGEQYDVYSNPAVTIQRGAYIWKESSALDYANVADTGGTANQRQAALKVEALRQGYRTTGKVKMILEEGKWKVDREKWVTDTSKKMPVATRN